MNVRVYKNGAPRDDRRSWLEYAAQRWHAYVAQGGPADSPNFRFQMPRDPSRPPASGSGGAIPHPELIKAGEFLPRADRVEIYPGESEILCCVRVMDDEFYYGTKTGRFYERDHDAERQIAQKGGAA